VAKLVDSSSDVREEAIGALYQIAGLKLYQGDVESSIPIIINQLAHESWNVRLRAIDILMFLVEHGSFHLLDNPVAP
jgi:HEAT repeat protein